MSNDLLGPDGQAEHRRSRRFPRDLANATKARHFVTETLVLWGLPQWAAEAEVPTAELVTNALVHSGDGIQVVVEADASHVLVEVHDTSRSRPALRRGRDVAESGRGLVLVEALADRWGFDDHSDLAKRVWFELGTSSAPG